MKESANQNKESLFKENRSFRNLFLSSFVSSLGDWFNSVAVLVLVLELTNSSIAVGVTLAMRVLPYLIAGPIGGIWSDRIKRTRIMIGSDMIRAILALGFLLVSQVSDIWLVYVLTGLMVVVSAFFVPAQSAYLVTIVEKHSLGRANALLAASNGSVMIIGFALGGWVTAQFGPEIAFICNALSFVLSAWFLRIGAQKEKAVTSRTEKISYRHELAEGIRAAAQNRSIVMLLLLEIGWAIGGGSINVLLSIIPHQIYGNGSTGVGFTYAALGAGSIIGSAYAAKALTADTRKAQFTAGCTYVVDALFHVGFAFSTNPIWGSLALIGAGAAGAVGNSAISTLIALNTEQNVQGRIFALFHSLGSSLLAMSMLGTGIALGYWGPGLTGTIGGMIILLFSLCYIASVRFEKQTKGCKEEYAARPAR